MCEGLLALLADAFVGLVARGVNLVSLVLAELALRELSSLVEPLVRNLLALVVVQRALGLSKMPMIKILSLLIS